MQIRYRHGLGANEAYRRVDGLLSRLQEQYGDQLSDFYTNWDSDRRRMDYRFRTHGLGIEGSIQLGDGEIVLNGKLPLRAKIFQGKIERAIKEQLVEQMGSFGNTVNVLPISNETLSQNQLEQPRVTHYEINPAVSGNLIAVSKQLEQTRETYHELEPSLNTPQLSSVSNSTRNQTTRRRHKNYLEGMGDYLKDLYHRSREWLTENPYIGFGTLGAILAGVSTLTLGPLGILVGATVGSFALGTAAFYSRHATLTSRRIKLSV